MPEPGAPEASTDPAASPVAVSFRRRARGGGGPRKRARPASPGAAAVGGADDGRRSVGGAAPRREKAARGGGGRGRRDVSWRTEYGEGGGGGAERAERARAAATAGRHAIDAADVAVGEEAGTAGAEGKGTGKGGKFGPLRAPAHIRMSVVTDMQPDVCKDYKETGFCGFGDACKFLHDRTVSKAGWQLDREWVAEQEERRRNAERGEDPDAAAAAEGDVDDDGLPFACFICRDGFVAPVVTLCGHYFCEACAVGRMEAESTCAACGKQVRGVLNTAARIVAKMERAAS